MFDEKEYIKIGLDENELVGASLSRIYKPFPDMNIIFKEYYNRDRLETTIGTILFGKEYTEDQIYKFINVISPTFAKKLKNNAVKLNYKCKREDSPDGSNKCPDDGKNIKEPKTKKAQLEVLGKKLSDVTGAEIVKLDGLQPQDVSTVLNTIKEESQYGEIKLKRIDNTQGRAKSAAMSFTPVNGAFELHLPVKYLKSERERIVEDDADTLIEHMKKTIEHNETEIEKLTSTTKRMNWRGTIAKQKEILRDLIERKESGKPYQPVLVSYHFKGDDRTKASTLHEIGHYRWYAELNDNDKNKLTETFKNISEDKYFPSKLSKQDNEEWIAEQYVMLRMGRECHPTIREVFGKLKSKQKK